MYMSLNKYNYLTLFSLVCLTITTINATKSPDITDSSLRRLAYSIIFELDPNASDFVPRTNRNKKNQPVRKTETDQQKTINAITQQAVAQQSTLNPKAAPYYSRKRNPYAAALMNQHKPKKD